MPKYDIESQGFNEFGRRSFDKSSLFVVILSQPSPTNTSQGDYLTPTQSSDLTSSLTLF